MTSAAVEFAPLSGQDDGYSVDLPGKPRIALHPKSGCAKWVSSIMSSAALDISDEQERQQKRKGDMGTKPVQCIDSSVCLELDLLMLVGLAEPHLVGGKGGVVVVRCGHCVLVDGSSSWASSAVPDRAAA